MLDDPGDVIVISFGNLNPLFVTGPQLDFRETGDFDLNIRRAIYRGHVSVVDPKVKMQCGWLVVDLPSAGGHLQSVNAETNVVIDFTDEKGQAYHVTAVRAVYDIMKDDAAMRTLITTSGEERAKMFDRLRKDYPRRREFFNTRVSVVPRNAALEAQLDVLGFSIGRDT